MAVQIPFATVAKVHQDAVVEDLFFTGLLEHCQVDDNAPQWLKDIRHESKDWLSKLSVPTKKDEDWRFIDLSSLTEAKFVAAQTVVRAFRETPLPETENSRLVFVNGIYNAELSECI